MDNQKKLPLSDRMKAIVDMVTRGNTCADIGCDHAYVPIYLYNEGICPKCLACDVKEGPLEAAKKNIELYNAGAGVETRLSDGLKAVEPGEAETIIIAGMGGENICRILKGRPETAAAAKELILEPQSEPEKVRKLLPELGFKIADEDMITESLKFYAIIKAVPTDEKVKYSQMELDYGPVLVRKMPKAFVTYLKRKRLSLIMILRKIGIFDKPHLGDAIEKAESELQTIMKLLTSYKKPKK